jgi:hypothetical protein
MESNRHWNVERHLERAHPGISDSPVRNKHSPSTEALWNKNALDCSKNNNSSSVECDKQRQREAASGEDPVSFAYTIFRRLKKRNDRYLEMKNYFENNGSNFRIPFYLPFGTSSYDASNIFPVVSSSECINSTSATLRTSYRSAEQSKVIGFEVYNCEFCYKCEALQIVYNNSAEKKLSRQAHLCDAESANFARTCPHWAKANLYFKSILSSLETITDKVNEWTQGTIYLIPLQISSDEIPPCIDDLRIEENQYGWPFRAISRGCTVLDAIESREFFDLANFNSFCCLSINFFEETRQKWKKESFYLFLNYKSCLPFEN